MKISIVGILTSISILMFLSGCLPPSKEIVAIEENERQTIDPEKAADLLPIKDFEPPHDPTIDENINP